MSSSTSHGLTAIVAATKSNGIGLNGSLPWRLPGEMKYFAKGLSCSVLLPDPTHIDRHWVVQTMH